MNLKAISRLDKFAAVTSKLLKGLVEDGTVIGVLNECETQGDLLKDCSKWGSSKYLFQPDDELIETPALFSNGSGVLDWISHVIAEFNSRGVHTRNIGMYPLSLEYRDCDDWKASFDTFIFTMIGGDLKITETRLKQGAEATGREVYTVISGWVYCRKNSFSYSQWTQFAANKMSYIHQESY
jgi:hypothetical protein